MTQKPQLIGVLNLTPDSYNRDGAVGKLVESIKKAREMIDQGASVVDVGGESTRPGAEPISYQEEHKRINKTLEALHEMHIPFSVDTYKPSIIDHIHLYRPKFINCTFISDDMMGVCGLVKLPLVIMHSKGNPQTMNSLAHYDNVVDEVYSFFEKHIAKAQEYGIKKIILDPGVGFAKKKEHSWELLRNLQRFKEFGLPILVGASRKGFVGKTLEGTLEAHRIALDNGADLLRVHDVKEHYELLESMGYR